MPASSDNGRDSVDSSKLQRDSLTRRQRRERQKKMEKLKPNTQEVASKSERSVSRSQQLKRPGLNLNAILPETPTSRTAVNKTGQLQRFTPSQTQPNQKLRQINLEVADSWQDEASSSQIANLRTPQPSLPPSPNTISPQRRQRKLSQQPPRRVAPVLPISGAKSEPLDSRQPHKGNRQPSEKRTISLPLQANKNKQSQPTRTRPFSPLLYGVRLLIFGIGLGALVGSVLSVWEPTNLTPATPSHQNKQKAQKNLETHSSEVVQAQASTQQPTPIPLQLSQEITTPVLKSLIQEQVKQNPKLHPGVFLLDLDNGAYFDWEATTTFSAASTIKVPILLAFFQDVDAGKIKLDEELIVQKEVIGGGSGDLQYRPVGTKLTALEVATKMIVISDNTATNMIIARLGGIEAVNQRFRAWGLKQTITRNLLPDLEGTNTTSPKELSETMGLINQGYMVSPRSRDRMLDIMQKTKTRTLLPQGLDKSATISHKTGDIGSMVGDVGLIDMPSGKRYLATVLVKRPHNNFQAKELIRKISRESYKYFSQPSGTPISTPSPSPLVTSTP